MNQTVSAVAAAHGVESQDDWHDRLLDTLVKRALIKPEMAHAARLETKVTGENVGNILVQSGFLRYGTLIEIILELDNERIISEQVSESRIPSETLDEHSILISAETETDIYVSTSRDEELAYEVVSRYYPEKAVRPVPFFPDRIEHFISRVANNNAKLSDVLDNTPHEEMLEMLVRKAISLRASDIHIQPQANCYSVFYRILGVRELIRKGSPEEYLTLISQAKDRARLDLAERRLDQDGSFQIEHNNRLVDLRVATLPEVEGERMVIRILDPDEVRPRLEDLGISRLEEWRRGAANMHGLCLICGPTGSGKTTTLNSTIRSQDRFGKAIYSVEDPVEYRIPYIGQVSVNTATGQDFSRTVRAFMRADPDGIMVGEIRDPDTARNTIKGAETGHIVFGTLHTGSIQGALSRLRDLNVPSGDLRYVLRAVLVQQLLRTVCKTCGGHKHAIGEGACPTCRGTGYSGRTVVSECASFADENEVDALIAGTRSWPTMAEDAYDKVKQGITTKEEAIRVLGTQFRKLLKDRGEEDF
ncbi:GspE/PulE family protein [Thalassospira xianhensis]|uniref:General secretion pathway protein E n=2 Tax=Thalassospira TaxID=168934 RepID=A0A285TT46_9PROT|nr:MULTISPECIES: GspE/PulE family protein [Thalassospira]RCK07849.1 hypothetical protein TH5_02155 [Thalassospira xianhensis MCCC 1A02616]SOC27232.1 general secretion pathway protein E [Thalassospira xiamenensis]